MNLCPGWSTFYEIIGSAAGALIGVQFVVVVLLGSMRMAADAESINAFGTPTIVHFSSALAIAAVMSAPWPRLLGPAITIAACGMIGFSYAATVFGRARKTEYKPVLEDWVWYAIVPCVMYAALTVAGLLLGVATEFSLFAVAAVSLCLLLIGVHNAWDSVTHLVVHGTGDTATPKDSPTE